MSNEELEQLFINTIRTLSIDAVQQAKSGHPRYADGVGSAGLHHLESGDELRSPRPDLAESDRFVLSNGHASMLLWSILHLAGLQTVNADYELLGQPSVTLDDIRRFRQLSSKAPGHPEYHWVSGVETTTDRGEGGKYLLLPPAYKGDLPDSGYNVARSRTTRVLLLGRNLLENNDPKPPVELIKKTLRIYPHQPGGFGTSIATALEGEVSLLRSPDGKLDWAFLKPQPPATSVEGSGKVMNTVPPSDFSYFEMIDELIQQEPADALDPGGRVKRPRTAKHS